MPPRSDIHAGLVYGKARIHRQGKVFFPATPVTTCTTLTRLESGMDAHTFVRLQPDRLFQLSNGGSTQEVDRETLTFHERRHPHTNTNEEVRQVADYDTIDFGVAEFS